MKKALGFVRLMRPINSLMMGIAVIVGAVLADPALLSEHALDLLLGFVTGFSLTAASMAINDYYDRGIDAINEPKRPIPSGLISYKEAMTFSIIFIALGFVAAFFTNYTCLIVAIISLAILVVYTTVGKRTGLPGNFMVSACVSIPFVYGGVVLFGTVNMNTILFASIAFLSNTGREVTKGIVDVQGDGMRKVKTVAVKYGGDYASLVAAFFFLFAVALSPVPVILGIVSFWFVPIVAVTDLGLTFSSIMLLKNHSRENAKLTKQVVLLWFLLGLLAFIAGAF